MADVVHEAPGVAGAADLTDESSRRAPLAVGDRSGVDATEFAQSGGSAHSGTSSSTVVSSRRSTVRVVRLYALRPVSVPKMRAAQKGQKLMRWGVCSSGSS